MFVLNYKFINGALLLALAKSIYSYCERFETKSHFKSRLSLIVRVNVVLNRTVVVDSDCCFDNLCDSHLKNRWGARKTETESVIHVIVVARRILCPEHPTKTGPVILYGEGGGGHLDPTLS